MTFYCIPDWQAPYDIGGSKKRGEVDISALRPYIEIRKMRTQEKEPRYFIQAELKFYGAGEIGVGCWRSKDATEDGANATYKKLKRSKVKVRLVRGRLKLALSD